MIIPPKYRLTPIISELLSSIEACRQVIDSISIPPEIEMNIRRQSILRSSLFSARIEGNNLTFDELSDPSKTQQKTEVFNILKATVWLNQRSKKDTSLADLLTLHKIALAGLTPEAGKFRKEASAIFNTAGIAIYMPPPPRYLLSYTTRLLKYTNTGQEKFVPIKACLAHFSFEKIHPFLDGNGRVGRLLLLKVLAQGGYGMKGLIAVEEYLDKHRSEYYQGLMEPEKDVTDYLEFMLEEIEETARQAKEMVLQKQKADVTDFLLPRRAEIYSIIKDHSLANFDTIRRRFMTVNERTLRYDLKKLQEGGLIRKRGTTKGVYYEIEKS